MIADKLKDALRFVLDRRGLRLTPKDVGDRRPDFTDEDLGLIQRVRPYTLTSPSRIVALKDIMEYVTANDLPGCFVECGVWRGGSTMAAMLTLLALGRTDVEFYLFDTYEGMTEPTNEDVRHDGRAAEHVYEEHRDEEGNPDWVRSGLEEVRSNIKSTGYPMARVHFVKGRVEDTLPDAAPEQVAVLRLDTDFYASTKHELECLFPRVVDRGVVFIDDYGYWLGSKRAADEYMEELAFQPLLFRIDSTGRAFVKSSGAG